MALPVMHATVMSLRQYLESASLSSLKIVSDMERQDQDKQPFNTQSCRIVEFMC